MPDIDSITGPDNRPDTGHFSIIYFLNNKTKIDFLYTLQESMYKRLWGLIIYYKHRVLFKYLDTQYLHTEGAWLIDQFQWFIFRSSYLMDLEIYLNVYNIL